jgi:NAD-dependent deacetylase
MLSARQFEQIVILTGAGISAESGIATFRDAGGLWEQHRPEDVATPEAFQRDPELVYRFYNARLARLAEVQPNPAHRALADLQQALPGRVHIVTQNVDDLHERGGGRGVIHMHGELRRMLCSHCGQTDEATAPYDAATVCGHCGQSGGMRPDVVWFGEIPYHMDRIGLLLNGCNLFIAVGTSGNVYPAAGFVQEARSAGAATLEVNVELSEVSGFFDHQRQGPAGTEIPRLVTELLA